MSSVQYGAEYMVNTKKNNSNTYTIKMGFFCPSYFPLIVMLVLKQSKTMQGEHNIENSVKNSHA